MTDQTALVLSNPSVRQKAVEMIKAAPERSRVVISGPKRTLPQNSRIWSGLKDIASQVKYHGQRLSADDFRTLFMDALWRETRLLPAIENDGWVAMRRATSDLSVKEAELFIALMYKWGYENGVVFSVDARDGIDHAR